jgi:hypothetical protein
VNVHALDPPPGPAYDGGFSFARTVQPVLDRYCIRCHGLGEEKADVSLLGTPEGGFSASYVSLVRRGGLVSVAHRNAERDVTSPKVYGAHAGRLAGFLLGEHREKAALDAESFERIAMWLDLNAQYYGDYAFRRHERRSLDRHGMQALRERVASRCDLCHEGLAEQPAEALINVAAPEESRVLRAKLSRGAGGWGQCEEPWPGTDAKGYCTMRRRVLAAVGTNPENSE